LDTLTHIVLGSCIGEAIAGKQLGKKALILGALAQNLPDIDFVASFWLPVSADVVAHRGITHSFLFLLLVSPALAWLSERLFKRSGMPFGRWWLFWGLQGFIHLFVDAFNAYGTGWFEPFSHYRVSFNSMYVADPLFSIWPAVTMIALLLLRKQDARRMRWVQVALAISGFYLLLGVVFKTIIDQRVERDMAAQHIGYKRYFTTPTPLNNLLWYIVAEDDSGFHVGYSAVGDQAMPISYHYKPRNEGLLGAPAYATDEARLKRFADGYYTAEMWHDTLVFNVLRFGEILGWETAQPKSSFYYFLQYPDANKMIVQRGRFAGWDKAAIRRYWLRMKGEQ
jgi:inner membrane protein